MAQLVKTIDFTAIASVKTVKSGLAIASAKTIQGVDNTAAGGFDPSTIASMVAWLKADAIVGLNDADPVTTWEDSFTSNNDLGQSTSGKKPTYQTNEINSLPCVRFDGSDDQLTFSGITTGTTFSIFVVLKHNLVENYGAVCTANNTAGLFLRGSDAGVAAGKLDFYSSADKLNTTALTANTWYYVGVVVSGGNLTFYRNGSSDNTGTSVASMSLTTVGDDSNGETFLGDIAEILIYTSAVAGGDLTNLHSYLATKYAL